MNPIRYANLGFANPYDDAQAPDRHALGFSTQPYPGMKDDERKEGPAMMPSLITHKISRGVYPPSTQPMLPRFPLGEVPTYDRQQGSMENGRGKVCEAVFLPSKMYSGDLVEAYTALESHGKMVPAPLSAGYQGSPFMYGPFIGLPPSHITNGGNFVAAYGETLRETSIQHRADMLIKDGYEIERVKKVMTEMLDDEIRNKLKGRK
jgi:hypothetical protein